ncbi:MAG: hypothetical protein ACLUE1_02535 [Adlercreutzia equolifaciens]
MFATMTFGEDSRTFLGDAGHRRHDAVGARRLGRGTQLLARADGLAPLVGSSRR